MKIYYSLRSWFIQVKYFFIHGWQFRNIRYWDHTYFFQTQEILFRNMEKSYKRSHMPYVGIEKDLRTIMVCKNLSRRLGEDDYKTRYSEKADKQLSKSWMEAEFVKEKGMFRMKFKEITRPDFIVMDYNMQESLRKRDIELLCKLIKNHVSKMWW